MNESNLMSSIYINILDSLINILKNMFKNMFQIMFNSAEQYQFLEKSDISLVLPSKVRLSLIKTDIIKVYKPESFCISDKKYYLDITTPKFSNLRWILYECNFPGGGEFGSLIFMGALRGRKTDIILVGDWLGQSFDLTSFVSSIPKHLLKYKTFEPINSFLGYRITEKNKDSTITSISKILDSIISTKNGRGIS